MLKLAFIFLINEKIISKKAVIVKIDISCFLKERGES